jgi:uncharacterized membrane protein YedE/YeeE
MRLVKSIAAYIRRESWSPYAAGILLGLVGILAVVLSQRTLGASGAVATLTKDIVEAAAPAAAKDNLYFRSVVPGGFTWELALLLGVAAGGFLGALSSGTFRLRWNGDATWNKIFGQQPWKRLAVGFGGAMVIQYGASLAGGCTSGLAISGGMLLAPSAFIFMGGMFASGILTAWLVYRRRY